jgi:hypothetical protein
MAIDSVLGWVAIDPESVRRVRSALDMSGQGVVDELGVGVLHTGYADHFFPGTSVLQTRARYLFFVPWTFLFLARKKVRIDALGAKKRECERLVTGQLIAHYDKVSDATGQGIIGVRVHPKAPAQPPDFAYWTAMNTWGFMAGRARSALLTRWNAAEVLRAAEATSGGEEAIETEKLGVFDVPPLPEGWPGDFTGGFDLTAVEAEWLRNRWARMHAPSLLRTLAALVNEGQVPHADTLWQDPMALEAAHRIDAASAHGGLPSFVKAIRRAKLASSAAEIMRATYGAYVKAEWRRDRREATGVEVPGLGYDARLAEYFGPKNATRARLLRLDVAELQGDLPVIARDDRRLDELLRLFQSVWKAAKTPDDVLGHRKLRDACELAEKRRKGLRARLPRVEGKERRADLTETTVRAVGIDYRWPVTKRLVRDVCEGLSRG